MPEEICSISSDLNGNASLPGTLILPNGKQPIRMGSGIITSLISSGGMAVVYEIWNAELEVKRAIKLLHPNHSKESEERFYTEMKITAKLHHPNIVEIYGVGRWNGLPFIEMERIDGITLHQILSECGRLPVDVCTSIGIIIGRALNYSHNQNYVLYGRKYHGIIHRDLKPGNIMITWDGTIKLMDFGIARPMNASIHTCEGTVLGTMQYLAPEQLDGSITDARADIYSLGCVLYEMLTGVQAFPETNIARLVPDKLNNTFVPLDRYSLRIPSGLVNLIHKCMRHDKERRVQNMLDFLKILGHIHTTITAEPPEKVVQRFMLQRKQYYGTACVRKKRQPLATVAWLSAGLAAALVVGISALYFRSATFDRLSVSLITPQRKTASEVKPFDDPKGSLLKTVPTDTMPAALASEAKPRVREKSIPMRTSAAPAEKIATAQEVITPRRSSEGRMLSPEAHQASAHRGIPPTSPAVAAIAPSLSDPTRSVGGPPSLAVRLKAQYNSNDLVQILASEAQRGNHRTVLELYEDLSASEKHKPQAIIYRLRAARELSNWKLVNSILESVDLRDGEFYLEKAMRAYRVGDLSTAENLLNEAAALPAACIDHTALYQSIIYGRAQCCSAEFDRDPSLANKRRAMAAWYELKSLLRSNPEHRYFRTADEEIRRINKIEVRQ